MRFEIKATKFFQKQFDGFPDKYKIQIKNKIELIKQSPFHFKSVHSKLFSRVFRIRLNIERKEIRFVYIVLGSKIILACFLDRDEDYKDLDYYLAKVMPNEHE